MRKIKFLLLVVIILQTHFSFSQKVKASDYIQTLKNGALFVRLKTSDLKITALKNKGQLKEAEEIRVSQIQTNESILSAFKKEFNFCPVYFFYSNNSSAIKEGNCKGFIFNVNQNIDTTFNSPNYLIGEFDESETTQMSAFIIKNKKLEQLRAPFPYMIKRNKAAVSARSDEEIIHELNEKLIRFSQK